jgi:paraquat-inducible protein B
VLNTQKLGSIGPGSPIIFRGIRVGEVMGYTLDGVEAGFTVRIFVRKPYDSFVRAGTRFWNASGISLTTGATGFKVEVESLQAVLAGGIAFETPEAARHGESSKEGDTFALYDDREQAQDAAYTRVLRAIVEFGGSVRGLDVGAPVEFRGMRIGKVLAFHLEFDAVSKEFRVPVTIADSRCRWSSESIWQRRLDARVRRARPSGAIAVRQPDNGTAPRCPGLLPRRAARYHRHDRRLSKAADGAE